MEVEESNERIEKACNELLQQAAQAVALCRGLPNKELHEYLASVSLDYRDMMTRTSQTSLNLMSDCLGKEKFAEQSKVTRNDMSTDDIFDALVEETDDALETALTKVSEISKRGTVGEAKRERIKPVDEMNQENVLDEMRKPQLDFEDWPIDNSESPFISKYERENHKVPDGIRDHIIHLSINNETLDLAHPFARESEVAKDAACKLPVPETPVVYKSLEDTKLTFVDSEEDLIDTVKKLKTEHEIAVDIEAHSMRSFQGFCCLIQISTRTEDFIVDTIKLRSKMGLLEPVFTDMHIVKVFHGADSDIPWLQRDFGLHVVNLFDTGVSARLLEFPKKSLAYLLEFFCDIRSENKKKYQMEDWRVRPIPDDMLKYARSDTHYLLYIFDRLRSLLDEKGLLQRCWHDSAKVAAKRYEKPKFDPEGYKRVLERLNAKVPWRSERVVSELFRWRDTIARREDESLGYVLPNRQIVSVAKAGNSARTAEGLVQACGKHVSVFVRAEAETLAQLVSDAFDANSPVNAEVELDAEGKQKQTALSRSGSKEKGKAERGENSMATVAIMKSGGGRRSLLESSSDENDKSYKDDVEIHQASEGPVQSTKSAQGKSTTPGSARDPSRSSSGIGYHTPVKLRQAKRASLMFDSDSDSRSQPQSGEETVSTLPGSFTDVREEVFQTIRKSTAPLDWPTEEAPSGPLDDGEAVDSVVAEISEEAEPEEMIPLSKQVADTAENRRVRKRQEKRTLELQDKEERVPDKPTEGNFEKAKKAPKIAGPSFDYTSSPWSLKPQEETASDAYKPIAQDFDRKTKGSKKSFRQGKVRRSSGSRSMSYKN